MRHKIDLRTALLAFALVAVTSLPVTAHALGLGEIKTDTRIGQPFSARIPITGVTTGELQGLHVDLAGHQAYQNANLSEPDYLFSLKFSVKQGPKGPYVLVSSEHPIKLPFLNLLINVRWASGEVTRQYTVLLNPPVFVSNSKSQQPVNAPQAPSSSSTVAQSASARQPVATRQPTTSQPVAKERASQPTHPVESTQASPRPKPQVSATAQPAKGGTTSSSMPATYKVRHGDTLWGLARRMRPSRTVSVNQMMMAVYQANPHAFSGNINRLKSGYVLQMPSRSQIAQLTAEEATRIVARQNNEWRSARQTATEVAINKASTSGSTGGKETQSATETAKTTESKHSQSQSSAPRQAPAASTSGRVVLTTPEVTATSSVAAAPGSAGAGSASAVSGGNEIASSTATSSLASVKGNQAAGSGASAGGPLKVRSNAMAGMASAGATSAGSEQTQKSTQAASTSTVAVAHNNASGGASAVNNTNSVNSVNSTSSSGSSNASGGQGFIGTAMSWVMKNTILAIIGAVIILLALVTLLYLVRRRQSGNTGTADSATTRGKGDPGDAGPEPSGDIEEGIPHETEGGAQGSRSEGEAGSAGDDLGIATYIGGPSLDVNKVDAIDESELHSGFGDYGKAAEVLREAIDKEPTRSALRHKLLEVLFAAGEGEAFTQEAALYREQATPEQWEEIAGMGRQLRPGEELFTEEMVSSEGRVADSADENTEFLNIDLDRLSSDTETTSDQSEFERTMDELSTFIETYVPSSADTPVSLQLPPEEEQEQEPMKEPEPQIQDDEPLEFTLDEGDLPASSSEIGATESEYEQDLDGDGEDESMVDTKLDLARAYIDMGDSDSARGVLEEVIDEGDDNQSGEARRLLESLG